MFRVPMRTKTINQKLRLKSTDSNFIRTTFVEYFVGKHGHKYVKSSPVVPLCDPTVPFVNAGMNQKEACQMAWDLLLGPYRLKPENLMVTYFAGDVVLGLTEDRETRDIWKSIGVPSSKLKALDSKDNFWEMGATGPCGPCTEIHYINADGTFTEIWNLVFIQFNREADGKVRSLRRHHVDTGLGLERMAALLQGVPSNYDTDLFQPIIRAIEQNSVGVDKYAGRYGSAPAECALDAAYRRLADHARMIALCLADGVFPASNLNLKQIMRKSFKISSDIFHNPQLPSILYEQVKLTLGSTYPELVSKERQAKLIIEHEAQAYEKMRNGLVKKWKGLVNKYPEVENMNDVELTGFPLGYTEFKETMSKLNSNIIPGELVFKLYDTHGFQEEIIERLARLNNLEIDKKGFWKLLSEHKSRHKTAFKEQASNRALLFDKAIEKIIDSGIKSTNDQYKYNYAPKDDAIRFEPLETKLVAILNEDCEWIDFLEPCEDRTYYLVTEDTNFYCEEGGQIADRGVIRVSDKVTFAVDSVFKIRDFVFHKGRFSVVKVTENNYINYRSDVTLEIDANRRVNVMRNHTAIHLLNAAIRKVLPHSVVCATGSSVTDNGLYLNLSVYGEKLTQEVVLNAQELVRELCCGTHVPSTACIEEFCITLALELFCRAKKLEQVIDLVHPDRRKEEISDMKRELTALCGTNGAPYGEYAQCVELLDKLKDRTAKMDDAALQDIAAAEIRDAFSLAAREGRRFVVHFVRCSYLMQGAGLAAALRGPAPGPGPAPALLLGCAGGVVIAVATVPREMVTEQFTAEKWLRCVTPVFQASVLPARDCDPQTHAQMTETKVRYNITLVRFCERFRNRNEQKEMLHLFARSKYQN
ncbi:unnamed protein product [Diatraea saccharalis]|uniref:alanine--tRNA ligase n=1 Tax=Diatraea saccharalis TaxID=40085 RepID=A0A9N9R4Q7_9NEOP|nr:unnamed protein product [Diatraea saccharalis]